MPAQPDRHFPASSAAFLPADGPLRREPIAPQRKRPHMFLESFEALALVYDCFWDHKGEAVILVGPPAINLAAAWDNARFHVGKRQLQASHYPSRSTQVIALTGVPARASEIALAFGDSRFALPIRENEADDLAGLNVLVTMNKDNDLAWIEAWARWHVVMHDANACLFFDNGSTRYGTTEIADRLGAAGITHPLVLSWPYKYGRKDPAILDRPHYPHFLQVSSLNVALRRFGMRANAILNCDIDELVSAEGVSVFDAARSSPQGIVTLKGTWVEPVGENHTYGIPHLAHRHAHRLPLLARCANKWALDPSRDWVDDLTAKPSVHRMYDVPKAIWADAPIRHFWHFKAINTGWKEHRNDSRPNAWLVRRLPELDAEARIYAGAKS